ncbi:MAG: serine/threonine protein kinase [Deltaproteobacteria bacterium]|nr:serine/threonine protein kinase [Deltaproteobacteria bacterium]
MAVARRFHLARELGVGSFGAVYLAEMESAGGFRRKVALKLLRPELDQVSDASRRLRDEARLLGRLRHRHIVQVDDLIRVNGRWAVVMEYVPGFDLEQLLLGLKAIDAPFPPLAAVQVTRAVALALDAAYTGRAGGEEPLRVVHRDIKPSNVRLTEEGEVKVLDFGIARADFQGREAKTEQVRYGSVAYMSPERLLGEEELPGGDIYGVGCVLYELIVGAPLGRCELAPDRQAKQLDRAEASLREAMAAREVPERETDELCKTLRAMLAYEVGDRPTAMQLGQGLHDLGRRLPGDDLQGFCLRVFSEIGAHSKVEERTISGSLVEQVDPDADPRPPSVASDSTQLLSAFIGVGPEGSTAINEPLNGFESLPVTTLPTTTSPTLAPLDPQWDDEPAAPPAPPPTATVELAPMAPERPHGLLIGVVLGVSAVVLLAGLLLGPRLLAPNTVASPPPPTPTDVVATPPVVAVPPAPPTAPVEAPAVVDAAPTAPEGTPPSASTSSQGRTVRPTPQTTTAPPPETNTTVVPEDTKRIRSAKFTVAEASNVEARCGDRSASGTSSALVRDLPVGMCEVSATVNGQRLSTSVKIDLPRGVTCAVEGGALVCR